MAVNSSNSRQTDKQTDIPTELLESFNINDYYMTTGISKQRQNNSKNNTY